MDRSSDTIPEAGAARGSETGAALDAVPDLSGLAPEQKRLMLRRLLLRRGARDRGGDRPAPVVPDAGSKHEPFPLTEIQQAYWLGRGDGFPLGGVGIHGYFEIDCRDLDLPRLNRAWQRVVERHDMMRAVVLPDGTQRILETVPFYEFEVEDLRGAGFRRTRAWLSATRKRMSHQVFDPERWPLFEIRATLLDGGRTRLHFGEDAIHVDLRSTEIVLRDWLTWFADPEAEPAPLALSYRDYVLALKRQEDSTAYRQSADYWRRRAAALHGAPDLPLARSLESLVAARFRRRSGRLDARSWRALQERGAGLGLTPSAVLLAAYGEVIGAWSRAERFSINATVYNRLAVHPDVEDLVGDFTSMMFADIDRTTLRTFEERAVAMQRHLWEDLEHRQVSGVEVLRGITRGEAGEGPAMMPFVFTSGLGTTGYRSFGELGRLAYSITQTPQVLIDQQVFEEDGALIVFWDAVDEAFPAGLLDDMHGAYCRLLERLAAEESPWRERRLDVLPKRQARRRAVFNDTAERVEPRRLEELFRERAAVSPDALAVISKETSLTYEELDRLSDRLAGSLVRYSLPADALVAVVMEKGWEQIAAVLAILKSGAAFVPIDPDLPPRRFVDLLARSAVRIALTQPGLDRRVPWPEGIDVLAVTRDPEPATIEPAPEGRSPADLAYVLYTSGSTGAPKGVMIEHKSVVNRMPEVLRRFDIGARDRCLAVTALQHDLSIFDVFGLLLAGGALVVPDAARCRDAEHWSELIAAHGVTVWNSVPAFLEAVVKHVERRLEERPEAGGDSPLVSLRRVLLSGDWIPVGLPDRLRRLAPSAEVISLGGPTETTVWDICHPVGAVDPGWASIPYGRPMRNALYHVLKENLEPCPDWVVGELHIGGAGLARGYWRDEELTARSFIELPSTGERVFRSGDLGRMRPEGVIELIGRVDRQIKLNGQRIELAEVESALAEHPDVERAVVSVVEPPGEPRRLVGWAVPRPDARPTTVAAGTLAAIEGRRGSDERRREGRERIALPALEARPGAYRRRTRRAFSREPVAAAAWGSLLGSLRPAAGSGPLARYRYPSAGSLYPVRAYVYAAAGRIEGCAAGFYWYDAAQHELVRLAGGALDASAHHPKNREIFAGSAFSLFLVGDLSVSEPTYGEQAMELCLLEAGYIGQLLMEEAEELELALCPIGGLDFAAACDAFGLTGDERLLHSICGGLPAQSGEDVEREVAEGEGPTDAASGTRATDESRRRFDRRLERELRELALGRLPASWVPGSIVLVDELPLSANGKVDVTRLPSPDTAARPDFVAPQTDLEALVARTWSEKLGAERIGRHDNFFDLGASSMELIEVFNALRSETGANASLVDFFRYPTVAGLAEFLSGGTEARALAQGRERASARVEARAGRRSRRRRPGSEG